MKEAVEEAFAAGLAKVVFATETLSLGINMPARSVVIEKLSKFTGERHEFLTPGEYTQLAGRAGRRGIDDVGYAIVLWSPFVALRAGRGAGRRAAPTRCARRSGRPTTWPSTSCGGTRPRPRTTCSTSRSRSTTPTATSWRSSASSSGRRELLEPAAGARARARTATSRSTAAWSTTLDAARRGGGAGRRIAGARSRRSGPATSCGTAPRRARSSCSARSARRGGNRVLALTSSRQLVRLGADDFRGRPRRSATSISPCRSRHGPGVPARGRRRAAPRRGAAIDDGATPATTTRRRRSRPRWRSTRSRRIPSATPRVARRAPRSSASSATSRGSSAGCRAAPRASPASSTACSRVLESWGYLDGWALTPAGELLARLYTETDLLLAESLREGLLDGLDAARARRARVVLHVRAPWPRRRRAGAAGALAERRRSPQRARASSDSGATLVATEDDAGLPETRPPDPGFTAARLRVGERRRPRRRPRRPTSSRAATSSAT